MTRIPVLFAGILMIFSCAERPSNDKNHFSLSVAPIDTVAMLAKGIISTRYNERDIAISPTADHLLYSMQDSKSGYSIIVECRKVSDTWTLPEVVSFSGNYSDLEPFFSPDGKKLYFVSNRPKEKNGKAADYNIWYVTKSEQGWSSPANMGDSVNSDKDEFYPSVSSNGNLYFTANLGYGAGNEDIYVSRFQHGVYRKPVALDTAINSGTYEFNAFVSPDETFILFSSYGRADDMGGGDLYISRKDSTGNWMKAHNLGPRINSKSIDYCPFVSRDNKIFFFTSERTNPNNFYNKQLKASAFKDLLDSALNGQGNIYFTGYAEMLRHLDDNQSK